jgi:hypothetical protein
LARFRSCGLSRDVNLPGGLNLAEKAFGVTLDVIPGLARWLLAAKLTAALSVVDG